MKQDITFIGMQEFKQMNKVVNRPIYIAIVKKYINRAYKVVYYLTLSWSRNNLHPSGSSVDQVYMQYIVSNHR